MKTQSKIADREHYTLKESDIANTEHFAILLNHLSDIPSSEASHQVSVTNAGIYNQKVMVHIEDFENPNSYVPVLCTINIGVDLHKNRGIHMSRSIQTIFDLAAKKYKTLDDFANDLARKVKEKQESQTGNAEIIGTYIHNKRTRKTQMNSYDRIYLMSSAVATNEETSIKTGVKAYNFTACPCTKTHTKFVVVPELKALGLTVEQINKILNITLSGTHTQRGTTMLLIDKESSNVTQKDLYAILEDSTHLIYELLKRPDEHDLVIRALQKPQFTEDVAREVAINAYEFLHTKLSAKAKVHVESLLNDSIHIHDVRAIIERTLGELQNEIKLK